MNWSYYINIIILTLFILCFNRCANPGVVTGGPKDTIPPILISSYPVDQTINFSGQTIILEFDELIAADKIHQNLIISPTTSIKFKHIIKKRTITIKFEEPFKDSTTYTFNFFDAVTDITEKNPPFNLVLAFSTGDYIDSLKIAGSVKNLMTNEAMAKMTVGLYMKTDTLNLLEEKPTYFTTTDKYGTFYIQNIKYTDYKILAFEDKNKNLKFDAKEESYAFKTGYFNPNEIQDSIYLYAVQIDATPLKLNSSRISGKYFDLRYSKKINNYQILKKDSTLHIQSNIDETGENIRFYNPYNGYPNDSSLVIIKAYDSLKNSSLDSVYISFRESSRKKGAFTAEIIPASGEMVTSNQSFTIKFNKPIDIWNDSTVNINYDSLHSFQINSYDYEWNHNRTRLILNTKLSKQRIIDSLEVWKSKIVIDSLQPDSTLLKERALLQGYPENKLSISIDQFAFISVDGDSSEVIKADYKYKFSEDFGTLQVNITSEDNHFFIQLTDKKKNQVFQEMYQCTTCQFIDIKPGDYSIRFLIDENMDGFWDIGNILFDREPEAVKQFEHETVIRSNFDMELDIEL